MNKIDDYDQEESNRCDHCDPWAKAGVAGMDVCENRTYVDPTAFEAD